MKRKSIIGIICMVVIVGGICFSVFMKKNTYLPASTEFEEVFRKEHLQSGDAKFFGKYIVTNAGKMLIFDLNGNEIKKFEEVEASWIDGIYEDRVIIFGNPKKETGIIRLDDDMNLIESYIIMNTETLAIDQTIQKFDDTYYATATVIEGVVNNADTSVENGKYSVKLYQSTDLHNWEYVSDIISANNNIEDVDLLEIKEGKLCLCFEKEVIDKGKSSIHTIISEDKGKTWGSEKELLAADSDHEPASFIPNKKGYELYYSSDKDAPGTSYSGAKIYKALYDKNFNLIQKDIELGIQSTMGNLLYDTEMVDGDLCLCFAQDYLSENNLCVEKIEYKP